MRVLSSALVAPVHAVACLHFAPAAATAAAATAAQDAAAAQEAAAARRRRRPATASELEMLVLHGEMPRRVSTIRLGGISEATIAAAAGGRRRRPRRPRWWRRPRRRGGCAEEAEAEALPGLWEARPATPEPPEARTPASSEPPPRHRRGSRLRASWAWRRLPRRSGRRRRLRPSSHRPM